MTKNHLDDALAEYGRAIDQSLATGEKGGTLPLGYAPEHLQQRSQRLRRSWRIQRTGIVLAPAFLALALGLHLWATDITARIGEERALATLYLLDEPAVPANAWDDLLLLDPEEEP